MSECAAIRLLAIIGAGAVMAWITLGFAVLMMRATRTRDDRREG